jgi:hypothetical protein
MNVLQPCHRTQELLQDTVTDLVVDHLTMMTNDLVVLGMGTSTSLG